MTNGARQASACLSFCGRVIFDKGDFAFWFQQREAFEREREVGKAGLGEATITPQEKSAKQ
jgi:hypothetical protein